MGGRGGGEKEGSRGVGGLEKQTTCILISPYTKFVRCNRVYLNVLKGMIRLQRTMSMDVANKGLQKWGVPDVMCR
jgi:hypothetical protein